jgi:hypothetical protein
LQTLQDWPGTGYYLGAVARHLFETFWGRFAWGHVALRGAWAYPLLAVATMLALVGSLIGWFGRRPSGGVLDLWGAKASLMQAAFILVTLAGLWGLAWLRGVVYLYLPRYYWPTARHAMPSLVLLILGLAYGWSELWGLASRGRRVWQMVGLALYLVFSVLLIGWSVYSIGGYYGYW